MNIKTIEYQTRICTRLVDAQKMEATTVTRSEGTEHLIAFGCTVLAEIVHFDS